ncbi:C-signal-like [Lissotriton helveticus]
MSSPLARTILITGCNRGIGLEIVRQLLAKPKAPEQIFATCRAPESPKCQTLNELAVKNANLKVIQLEATDPTSVIKAAKEVEAHLKGVGLNVLINNAGIMPLSTLETVDGEDLLHVYMTNVVGPLLITKAFLHLLKKAAKDNPQAGMSCSKAALINMSTIGSSIALCHEYYGVLPVVSYRCSKAALNMLTKCQSLGYKSDGILCTAIHPGWVQTDLGGPEAILTPKDSVKGILNVLYSLTEKNNGCLLDWEGKSIPW